MKLREEIHKYVDRNVKDPYAKINTTEALVALFRVWALEMVGEDSSGLGEAIAESEGAYNPSKEEMAEEEGFNNRGKVIRKRIEEATE